MDADTKLEQDIKAEISSAVIEADSALDERIDDIEAELGSCLFQTLCPYVDCIEDFDDPRQFSCDLDLSNLPAAGSLLPMAVAPSSAQVTTYFTVTAACAGELTWSPSFYGRYDSPFDWSFSIANGDNVGGDSGRTLGDPECTGVFSDENIDIGDSIVLHEGDQLQFTLQTTSDEKCPAELLEDQLFIAEGNGENVMALFIEFQCSSL
ncbi:unnamed protein product [Chrysoparadoxa australica]